MYGREKVGGDGEFFPAGYFFRRGKGMAPNTSVNFGSTLDRCVIYRLYTYNL